MKHNLTDKDKYYEAIQEYKKKCYCGHPQLIPVFEEYVICTNCNCKIYRDDAKQEDYQLKIHQEDFRYKLGRLLK